VGCRVYGFKYSQRPFTPALRLGRIGRKSERLARLFDLENAPGTWSSRGRHGTGARGGPENARLRCTGLWIVHLDAAEDHGQFVEVRISRFQAFAGWYTDLDEATARGRAPSVARGR
jgi:hypothetical protein